MSFDKEDPENKEPLVCGVYIQRKADQPITLTYTVRVQFKQKKNTKGKELEENTDRLATFIRSIMSTRFATAFSTEVSKSLSG